MKFYCIGFTLDPENPLFPLRERVRERIADGGSAVIGDMSGLSSAFQTILNIFSQPEFDHTSEMLKEKSVTEVADALGYSSIHSFSKAYKNFHTTSPKNSKQE